MGRAFEFRKARKMKRWSAMAKTFTRIGKDIVMAVKEGGPDPDNNSRLRAVIQNAKAANMPKDNIERAIKKASDKNTENYKEVLFEGYAPYGIALLVETATDNNNRTVANVRSYFNKANGNLGTSGSVEFMFDRSCNFRINPEGIDPEELELEFIDFGVEEVFADEDGILLYGPFEHFGNIQKELEKRSFEILSSGFERIPQTLTKLTAEQTEEVEKLIEKSKKTMMCKTSTTTWTLANSEYFLTGYCFLYLLSYLRIFWNLTHYPIKERFEIGKIIFNIGCWMKQRMENHFSISPVKGNGQNRNLRFFSNMIKSCFPFLHFLSRSFGGNSHSKNCFFSIHPRNGIHHLFIFFSVQWHTSQLLKKPTSKWSKQFFLANKMNGFL